MSVGPIGTVMAAQVQPVIRTQVREKQETNPIEKIEKTDKLLFEESQQEVKKTTKSEAENPDEDQNFLQQQQEQQQKNTKEKLMKSVEELNKNMYNSEAVFGIHEKTNRVTIKIVDKETKELIKEFPPEKTLDLIAKAWEMAGLLVDERR